MTDDTRPAPAIPAAPTDTPTPSDVDAYPAYYTDCPHGYRLTDSCPPCDAD